MLNKTLFQNATISKICIKSNVTIALKYGTNWILLNQNMKNLTSSKTINMIHLSNQALLAYDKIDKNLKSYELAILSHYFVHSKVRNFSTNLLK